MTVVTFNGPLEAGIRVLSLLLPAYPRAFDLQRLVAFDYLIVHTGDVNGPESLHPELPLRSAEILVRREIVERGILLMMSHGLLERRADSQGIVYYASDLSSTFMSILTTPYINAMRERGEWVVKTYEDLNEDELRDFISELFGKWVEEFQIGRLSLGTEL